MFVVVAFAIWRLAVLLQRDDGPFDVFKNFRDRYVMDGDELKDNVFAKGYGCFFCLTVWLSFLGALYLCNNVVEFVIYTLALSGAAIIIDNFRDNI